MKLTLKDGSTVEERQGHIRGGVSDPLSRAEIENKFRLNAEFGGWSRERIDTFLGSVPKFFEGKLDLRALRS
jgi:hypothetical protein